MQLRDVPQGPGREIGSGRLAGRLRPITGAVSSCILAVVSVVAVAQQKVEQSAPGQLIKQDIPVATANQTPDANDQLRMKEERAKKQNFAAAEAERKKQIADDTEKLLKLAADLKVEVDKTSKDTLSLNVIRKAEEIERLAHAVKEKMKLTVGGS
jgi:hypothetical protein